MPKYIINSEEKHFEQPLTISELTQELALAQKGEIAKGLAIAVNNTIVPKTKWSEVELQENDNIVIIKAACGG